MHYSSTVFNLIEYTLSNENIFDHGRVFCRTVTAFEIFSWPNFNVDLDHENGNILKNGFLQRILLVSKYPKRVGAKIFYFFKTLLDGPLQTKFRKKTGA